MSEILDYAKRVEIQEAVDAVQEKVNNDQDATKERAALSDRLGALDSTERKLLVGKTSMDLDTMLSGTDREVNTKLLSLDGRLQAISEEAGFVGETMSKVIQAPTDMFNEGVEDAKVIGNSVSQDFQEDGLGTVKRIAVPGVVLAASMWLLKPKENDSRPKKWIKNTLRFLGFGYLAKKFLEMSGDAAKYRMAENTESASEDDADSSTDTSDSDALSGAPDADPDVATIV